jgi:DNA-binding PadR family transcriptional regulator
MTPDKERLPRHKRVENPPRIKLTERDVQVILAVYEYRLLRREQIERLFFPSPNTANERLKRLYQHGFLERRWLPVEYGQGTGQAIYLLTERGADLVAERLGLDRGAVDWKESYNQVSTPFLEHALGVNQVRIAFTLAVRMAGYQIGKWVGESELRARPDYVQIATAVGARKVAVIPDGYFILELGERRAHFFLESDRATEANKRWGEKVQAYLEYTRSGQYAARYGARSLRVLTVTTGEKRLANLKRATEQARGREMFWFTTVEQAQPEGMVAKPIWQVAGREELCVLIEGF